MTYYQKKRVIAKLKRIRNQIKYNQIWLYPEEIVVSGMQMIDQAISAVLDEPCTFYRGKPLPKRF